jgi:LysM repeat protein
VTPQVTLRSTDGRYSLTALFAPDLPVTAGGRGGWEEAKRPRKPAITQWTGPGAATATVTVILDAWSTDGSVEPHLRTVEGLAPRNATTQPPALYVIGAPTIPATTPWVVQEVTFSDILRRDSDGAISRITLGFDLIEYRPGDVVVYRSDPAKRSTQKNGSGTTTKRTGAKTYTVKRGDTLGAIAAKYLGSAAKWTVLAKLNGIRNPNSLKVGTKLKLQ